MKLMKIIALFLVITPFYAQANEDALYAPAPPADSAFVRTINASSDTESTVAVDGRTFEPSEDARISNYSILKNGEYEVTHLDQQDTINVKAGHYYSVVITSDNAVKLIEDDLIEDPSKAKVYFYNLSGTQAALTAPSHKATIFENVASLSSEARDINAVTFDVAIEIDNQAVKTFPGLSLKRQIGTSIILFDSQSDDSYEAIVIENTVQQ